jgi:hypothetical protein
VRMKFDERIQELTEAASTCWTSHVSSCFHYGGHSASRAMPRPSDSEGVPVIPGITRPLFVALRQPAFQLLAEFHAAASALQGAPICFGPESYHTSDSTIAPP